MSRSRPLLSTMLKRSRYLLTAILGTAFADASVMAADPAPVPAPTQSVETVNFLRRATPYGARSYAPVPCPPQAMPVVPTDPNAPKVDPAQPQPVAPIPPDTSMARTDQGGTAAIHTNAPNLFGDLFGAKASIITQTTNGTRLVTNTVTGNLSVPATVNPPMSQTVTGNLGSGVSLGIPSIGFSAPITIPGGAGVNFTQSIAPGAPANPANIVAVSAALNPLLQPGQVVFNGAAAAIQASNPQATLQSLTIAPIAATTATSSFAGGTLSYGIPITSTTAVATTNTVVVGLPTPGAGGVVGLLKISEDNSPFPRDRVIFTYDYFDNTQISTGAGAGGIPVNRYQFGFEKTAFQGRASFEVRVPFANTQSSSANFGQESLATEFGNIRLTGKALLRRGEVLNLAGGLGISLPTADDISLSVAGRGEVIHVNNRSVQLSPFLALQLTPNERLFAQAWYGFLFDTGGNSLTVDTGFFAANGISAPVFAKLGDVKSASLQTIDAQIGYWIYQSEQGLLRGLAPFLELHYTGDTGKGSLYQAGGLVIGDTTNYEEFNLTAGVTTRIAQNTTLAVAAAAPLLGQNGRTFDYQIGVRLNWYFGYTARQRQNGAASNLAPNSF